MSSYLLPCTLKPLWRAVWNHWLHLTSFTIQSNVFLEVLNVILLIMTHQTLPVRTLSPSCCKIQTLFWLSYCQPLSSKHISLRKYSTCGIFPDFCDPTPSMFLRIHRVFCWRCFPAHPRRLVFSWETMGSVPGPLFPPSHSFYSSHTFLSILSILLIVYSLRNHRPVITKTCLFSPILLPLPAVNCIFFPFQSLRGALFIVTIILNL